MTTTAANMFNNIIGQDAASVSYHSLSTVIVRHRASRLLTAPKGTGKTMLAKGCKDLRDS